MVKIALDPHMYHAEMSVADELRSGDDAPATVRARASGAEPAVDVPVDAGGGGGGAPPPEARAFARHQGSALDPQKVSTF